MKEVDIEVTLINSHGLSVSSTSTIRVGFEIETDLHWTYTTLYFDDDSTVAVNLCEITAMYMPHSSFQHETATAVRVRARDNVREVPLTNPETFHTPCLYTLTGAVTITESNHEAMH